MAWTIRVGASTGFPSGVASTGLSGGVWRVSHLVTPLNAPLSARTGVGVVVGMAGVAGGAVSIGAGVAGGSASVRTSVAGVWVV